MDSAKTNSVSKDGKYTENYNVLSAYLALDDAQRRILVFAINEFRQSQLETLAGPQSQPQRRPCLLGLVTRSVDVE